jgi:glycosyltransferase involved in cell wall biosynthesis
MKNRLSGISILGGSGFIGTSLVEYLLSQGEESIRILSRNKKIMKSVSIIEGELMNSESLSAPVSGQGLVKKYDLEKKVKFIGFVQDKLKSELYHAADLLVIPSRLEAMSIVVLESAIAGTPVLMTNTCGLNEMTRENGAYSVSLDANSLEEGLRVMLSKPDELDLKGNKIKIYVENSFSWDSIVKKYVKMYEDIITSLN